MKVVVCSLSINIINDLLWCQSKAVVFSMNINKIMTQGSAPIVSFTGGQNGEM